jgi:hypothetical protein
MWWAKYLLFGFSFLAIHEEESFLKTKRVLEFILPGALSVLSVIAFWQWGNYAVPNLLYVLNDKLFQLVVFMVPFHLAALAALATFQSPILDQVPAGAAASIRTWSDEDNDHFQRPLKMREYACRLFGYLCMLGIIYLVASIIASVIDFQATGWAAHEWLRMAVFVSIAAYFWHYIVMSLYAIYFLIAKTV